MIPDIKKPYGKQTNRRLSDLKEYLSDKKAANEMLEQDDPIIYNVYEYPVPNEVEHLIYGTTVLFPGKVKDEFYFTKGHFHNEPDGAEVIIGIEGSGLVLLQNREGEFRCEEVKSNSVVYSPPGWAHRAVNTSKENFVFLSICKADVGHDYEAIISDGFAKRVVEKDKKVSLIN